MVAKGKDILLSRPVHELLGVALGSLETRTGAIAQTYGETVEIGNAHHENGPEEFWREELSRALSKLQGLKEIHQFAKVYEPSTDKQQVRLGSGVRVMEMFSGEEEQATYTVVSANDILVCTRLWVTHPPSWLNAETTRGVALMGRWVGEKNIVAKIPVGEVRMEIREVVSGDFSLTLPNRLSGRTS